jgi:hypothetical protein
LNNRKTFIAREGRGKTFERRKAKHPEFTPGLTTAIHLQHILILFVIFLKSEKAKIARRCMRSIVIAIFQPNLKQDRALAAACDRSIEIDCHRDLPAKSKPSRFATRCDLIWIRFPTISIQRIDSILWPMTSSNDEKTRQLT